MKKVFLLIVVPALLVALGFAQTPAASSNTDQINIEGCLGGSDGNYTVAENNTGRIFKITTSSVDLKPHLGHGLKLIGHRASEAGSAAADNSLAVTELNMISEHCAAAAAAPTAIVSTPPESASTPAATATPPAESAVTPAADAPVAIVSTPAETASTPAIVATPPAEHAVTPAAATLHLSRRHPSRLLASLRRRPRHLLHVLGEGQKHLLQPPPAAPAVTSTTSSEPVSTPAAAAITPVPTDSASSEPARTPAAPAATPAATPTATSKGFPFWLMIAFAVLIIVIGTLFPFLNRWRKQRSLERTGAPNLSFNREASSDQGKRDPQGPRKAA